MHCWVSRRVLLSECQAFSKLFIRRLPRWKKFNLRSLLKIYITDSLQFEKILFSLGLQHLISLSGGLDEEPSFEWQDTLSPGEQQRLSIARLLYRRPAIAVLDEATSSLSEQVELQIYNLIKEVTASNRLFQFSSKNICRPTLCTSRLDTGIRCWLCMISNCIWMEAMTGELTKSNCLNSSNDDFQSYVDL